MKKIFNTLFIIFILSLGLLLYKTSNELSSNKNKLNLAITTNGNISPKIITKIVYKTLPSKIVYKYINNKQQDQDINTLTNTINKINDMIPRTEGDMKGKSLLYYDVINLNAFYNNHTKAIKQTQQENIK